MIIKEIQKAINSNNLSQVKYYLDLIDEAETGFLTHYHRKKKEGVYFTNIGISKFIFSEILHLKLSKELNNESFKDLKTIELLDPKIKQRIFNFLSNLKILDPSCGSGVFLISAAEILLDLLHRLNPNMDRLEIKIQLLKNLYGFDINNIAIKLSHLKLFKWIFEDNEQIFYQILPILNSNLKVKNTILTESEKIYDIIIGNPPYGRYTLADHEKLSLRTQDISYDDLYCVFLLKMIDWSNGVIGFLVPKSFLIRQGYAKFRNILLSKANINKIFDIGPNIFKMATNEVVVFLYEKKEKSNIKLKIYDYPNVKLFEYLNQNFDNLRICYNQECPQCSILKKIYAYTFKEICPYCGQETIKLNRIRIKMTPEIHKLINRIEEIGDLNFLNIKNFPKMIRGEESNALRSIRTLIHNNLKGTCLFINAKQDFSYFYLMKTKSFNLEEISQGILKGKDYEYYKSPKLLIKHNNIFPQAFYTEELVCFTSSIYSLLHENHEELKFLCGILNSILMQFYCIYGINNQKDTTINLNQYMIRHLPIISPEPKIRKNIIQKTESLIRLFESTNGKMDKKLLTMLKALDNDIFDLYALSPEERILIINSTKNQIKKFQEIYH